MKVSVILATKNRGAALVRCLESIAVAYAKASPIEAEIVVVDNGSSDNTSEIVQAWKNTASWPVKAMVEPGRGKAVALNRGLRVAEGDLLVFIDDDCRMSAEYVNDLLRHNDADRGPVLRGGRIELGDPNDLPFTINTCPTVKQWSLAANSARYDRLAGYINGCNMALRRSLMERVGLFDENLGPGAPLPSGDDLDYIYRAYLLGTLLEYVPDMTVFHDHGRKTNEQAIRLFRNYMTGNGAMTVKYLFRHPNFARPFVWDVKNAVKELISGTNTFLPSIGFSHRDKVVYGTAGAIKYLFVRKRDEGRFPDRTCR
jgi:glycosyltransferase involved in cell wall biosynthesis